MNKNYSDDSILIIELKKGKENAYRYLVDNYHHKLCVYAYNLTNDYDLSEDIVQNVFMNIWKRRKKLKNNFALNGYLYKSIYNEFIDQYRKNKKVLPLEKKYIEALNTVLYDESESSLERLIALMKSEVQKLPPKCKQTFILSKQDGLTNIEIAEHLNVSIKSVEAHITKAFSILRKTLGEKMNGILFLLFGFNASKKLKIES